MTEAREGSHVRLDLCTPAWITSSSCTVVTGSNASQVLESHPSTYFLLLGREHPSEVLAGRLMKNLIDQAILTPALPLMTDASRSTLLMCSHLLVDLSCHVMKRGQHPQMLHSSALFRDSIG